MPACTPIGAPAIGAPARTCLVGCRFGRFAGCRFGRLVGCRFGRLVGCRFGRFAGCRLGRFAGCLVGCLFAISLNGSGSVTEPVLAQQEVLEAGTCEIQGISQQSPFKDKTVITHGVVTRDLRDTSFNGFFLEDPNCDDNPATSNGVWVYQPKGVETPPDLAEGRCVVVTGEVNEYFALTEIVLAPDGVLVEGPCDIPAPTPLNPPQDVSEAAIHLEAREGMLVSLPPSRVIGATNQYGDSYVVPDDSGVKRVFRTALDGRRVGMLGAGWWFDVDHDALVSGVVGGLIYNYENYKVLLKRGAALAIELGDIERPQSASAAGPDELSIATYNLENLFDPVDNPDKVDEDSAPTAAQYDKTIGVRACSIVTNLRAPDIIGLQEVENERVLVDLAEAVRRLTIGSTDPDIAGATYVGALVEGPDARGIDVAWLFRTDRVRLLTFEQRRTCSTLKQAYNLPGCDMPDGGRGTELYGRPPLIARFEVIATGGRINLIVNHFKSKSGGDAITTPLRTAMAEHNIEMVRELKAAEPDVPVIVLGDLNDFEDSEPILALTADGLQEHRWPQVVPEDRYSFIFNGVSQILDYIFVEPAMDARFSAVHTNADTATVLIDDMRGTCAPGEPHERASDHEPLLLRLDIADLPAPGPRIEPVFLPALLKSGVFGNGAVETPRPSATDAVFTDGSTPPQLHTGNAEVRSRSDRDHAGVQQGAATPPRIPPAGDDEITIATYNVHDLQDLGAAACSIAYNLGMPTILGLQEPGAPDSVTELIGLAEAFAWPAANQGQGVRYGAQLGTSGGGDRLAFLFDVNRLTLLSADEWPACVSELPGASATPPSPLYCTSAGVPGRFRLADKPPYVARFEVKATGSRLNVINNHWKAGTTESDSGTRELQAAHVRRLVDHLRRTEPEVPIIVLGDFNATPGSLPLHQLLECDSLVDPLEATPPDSRPTCGARVFDYVLLSRPLSALDGYVPQINLRSAGVPFDATTNSCVPGNALVTASDHNPVLIRFDARQLPTPGPPPFSVYLPQVQAIGLSRATSTATEPPLKIATLEWRGAGGATGEYVTLLNRASVALSLSSWHVHSAVGDQTYRFPTDAIIEPNQECSIYTNSGVYQPGCRHNWNWYSGQGIWANGGDAACLYDAVGSLVDCRGYGAYATCTAACPTAAKAVPTAEGTSTCPPRRPLEATATRTPVAAHAVHPAWTGAVREAP